MRRILKANWLLNTSEIRRQKYAIETVGVLLVFLILIAEILRNLLRRYININMSNMYLIYMIVFLSEVVLFPMQIFKKVLFRKDEIMLYMAGIEKKSIYSYYFLKNIIITNIVIFIISRLFLETIIIEWDTYNTLILCIISSVGFIEMFLLEMFLKKILKRNIYKEIAILVSIEEVISSVLFYSYLNAVDYKLFRMQMTSSKIDFLIISLEIVYFVKIVIDIRKTNQISHYKKDFLLIKRDFDSVKYIVASVLLYMIPIILSKKNPCFFNLIVVVIIFIINIITVLGLSNFKLESKYYMIYVLAKFDEKKYLKEKKKFFLKVCMLATMCLDTTLMITQNLNTKEVLILYAISFLFCKLNAILMAKLEHKIFIYYNNNQEKFKKWKEIIYEK
ncbi:hypothetical protein [Lachnobacterium bovis]|uniref:hypothetical protein n=1 Tax=Lachnobacterium bovis TaxID=140626 RepID=UPI0003B4740B|nr:hypothetical protein [Lachnobacterium bovis]